MDKREPFRKRSIGVRWWILALFGLLGLLMLFPLWSQVARSKGALDLTGTNEISLRKQESAYPEPESEGSRPLEQPVTGQTSNGLVETDTAQIGVDAALPNPTIEAEKVPDGVPLELVWISPGSFWMGSPTNEVGRHENEGPLTHVTITRGYWLGKYEVTCGQCVQVVGRTPLGTSSGEGDMPIDGSSWVYATNFCCRLTSQEAKQGRLPAGYEYRLPTEAEWEYACRAGTRTRFSFGDDESSMPSYGRCGAGLPAPAPIGRRDPNPWGLYDMHGNVSEWCLGWLGPLYPGGEMVDPVGAIPTLGEGSTRREIAALRGGTWHIEPVHCRSAHRDCARQLSPTRYLGGVGFRVALAPPALPK